MGRKEREADTEFIRDRIAQLREKENMSEYELSRKMGHHRTYIQNIVTGKSRLPHTELMELCRIFKITPEQFFSQNIENPALFQQIVDEVKGVQEADQHLMLEVARRINRPR